MKKLTSLLLVLSLCMGLSLLLVSCGGGDEEDPVEFIETEYAGQTLYVYNWGEYISDGSEGTLDVVKRFEETYGITVKYDFYSTNEELYAQLNAGSSYDVIIPSDYMIARLAEEGLIQELDKSKLSNYDLIDPAYRGQYFDPEDKYTVPYAVGMIGIVYNTKMVDEADVGSWDLLWNKKYGDGQIINFNNPRDAFGVAMLEMGLDINTTAPADWQAALNRLKEQDCIYLMDEIFNKMENGTSAVAAYYAGDCLSMMDVNSDLAFYYPEEGTNIFIDAMCIPSNARNEGAAHLFIDFMTSVEIATANANYICYASPNMAVRSNPDYDFNPETNPDGYGILYELPESYAEDASKMQYYQNLDDDTLGLMNDLWIQLGVTEEEGGINFGTILFLLLIVGGVGYIGYDYIKKIKNH